MTTIDDANALRGAEFKQLLSDRKTQVLIGVPALIGAIVGFTSEPASGMIVPVVIVLIGLLVTFFVADRRAAKAFYSGYAKARGLTWSDSGNLDRVTPFLKKGDKRKVNQMFTGELAEGIEGTLALYTYTEESTDSDGNRDDTDYPFTLTLIPLPETMAHLAELRVQRKSGLRSLEKFEDAFRLKHERVTLESEAMLKRYEVFTRKDQDPIWVRRLFSPSFIVWLTETPPKNFAFELFEGHLCAYVPKHRTSAADLDQMIAAGTHLARALREEVEETSAIPGS